MGGVFGSNLDWRTKTTETRPDGTERIVYSNARTQPMLEVIRTTEGGVAKQQGTYTRYNFRGQAIWKVSPEAITLPANLEDIEQYPDLLNEVAGNFQYISDSIGLIEVTNYAVTTTATAATAGSVGRFVSSTAVMRGDRGTPVLQEAFTYESRHVQKGRCFIVARPSMLAVEAKRQGNTLLNRRSHTEAQFPSNYAHLLPSGPLPGGRAGRVRSRD